MKYALLPDLTQASPQGGLRLLLTVDLGSTMGLFPSEANIDTEIQVQMVYLAVIPENTREECGEVEGKQHGTVSRITMWAMGSVLLGTSQRPGRSNFGVISLGIRRLGYLSSNFSH